MREFILIKIAALLQHKIQKISDGFHVINLPVTYLTQDSGMVVEVLGS